MTITALVAVALLASNCSCGEDCPPSLTPCEESCEDLNSDPANCGACGNVCAGAETCSAGVCTGPACAPPNVACATGCCPPPAPACTTPSVCGGRQYCNADKSCLCLRSTEGENRCGQVPSTCHAQLCKTSADCANLGEGYFCDTPNSGCCTDPPKELSRCVAPCMSPPTDGGGPDGGPGDGGIRDGDDTTGAEAERYQRELERVDRGEPADMDGDGQADTFQQVLPDGAIRYWKDANGNSIPEYTSVQDVSGNSQEQSDANEDGHPEYQRTFSNLPSPRQMSLWDVDENGTYELRETVVFGQPDLQVRVIIEEDPDGDGSYSVVSDSFVPEIQPQSSEAEAAACTRLGFPVDVGTTPVKEGRFHISSGTKAGNCTPTQAKRIQAAIRCALKEAPQCLKDANKALGDLLDKALKDYKRVKVSCSNACNYVASTYAPSNTREPAEIAFNPSKLDEVKDGGDLCAGMVHELIHLTRFKFAHDHDEGKDQIYACGRYCGGCSNFPVIPGARPSKGENCAVCAGTLSEKSMCGMKVDFGKITCRDTDTYCHDGLSLSFPCQECKGNREFFCDNTVKTDQVLCCEKCPIFANRSNDVPCSTITPGPTTDNCQSPPNCRK